MNAQWPKRHLTELCKTTPGSATSQDYRLVKYNSLLGAGCILDPCKLIGMNSSLRLDPVYLGLLASKGERWVACGDGGFPSPT